MIQNDFMDLLNNPEKVQRVDTLVEDIQYALIDYQVCTAHQTYCCCFQQFCTRLHFGKTFMKKAVKKL